jgi:hypothetical protein
MVKYIIKNLNDWNKLCTCIFREDDIIILTQTLGCKTDMITKIKQLEIPKGVKFKGCGRDIYLNVTNFAGLIKLSGGIISGINVILHKKSTLYNKLYETSSFICSTQSFGIIKKCSVVGQINTKYGGGIASSNFHGNISQCFFMGSLNSLSAGGIIGSGAGADSKYCCIQNCFMIGSIKGTFCGGIAGSFCGLNNGKCVIKNCFANIEHLGGGCGGIVGKNCGYKGYVTIKNCYVTGESIKKVISFSGGITGDNAGYQGRCSIINCYTLFSPNININLSNTNKSNATTKNCVNYSKSDNNETTTLKWKQHIWNFDKDYPRLQVFMDYPWKEYNNHNDIPLCDFNLKPLIKNLPELCIDPSDEFWVDLNDYLHTKDVIIKLKKLPHGINYDSSTSVIEGSNLKPGNYKIDVNVFDYVRTHEEQLTIKVAEEPKKYVNNISGNNFFYNTTTLCLVSTLVYLFDMSHNKGYLLSYFNK